jgi:hypothetical protein
MFPTGSRVRFLTLLGECLGTVDAVLDEAIEGDHVHRVRPDDGAFPTLLLLGRSLRPEEDADTPIILVGG